MNKETGLLNQKPAPLIAHRISTVKNADKIYLMDKGEIKNSGAYRELLNKSTYFKRLVELQEL